MNTNNSREKIYSCQKERASGSQKTREAIGSDTHVHKYSNINNIAKLNDNSPPRKICASIHLNDPPNMFLKKKHEVITKCNDHSASSNICK